MVDLYNTGKIQMTRGDSVDIPITINQGTAIDFIPYQITDYDTLYFAVMEPNQKFEDAIIKKKITKETAKFDYRGNLIIQLESKDTENLITGQYYYCLKMQTIYADQNIVQTIISNNDFYII